MAAKKVYSIEITRFRAWADDTTRIVSGTLDELIEYCSYTLEVGESWQHERGNHKINRHPRTIGSLINNLNWSETNRARNGCASTYYKLVA